MVASGLNSNTMQESPANVERYDFIEDRKPLVPSGVLAMLLFIVSELMLFAGLISAFIIVKSNAVGGVWPPPGQPRLPVEQTAFNTVVLLASGVCMFLAHRAWSQGLVVRFRKLLFGAFGLAVFFVIFQGYEWVGLLGEGLTMQSGAHGATHAPASRMGQRERQRVALLGRV